MNKNRTKKPPVSVSKILVDDILETSDEDVFNESRAIYEDIESEIENTRNIINAAVLESRRSRLSTAREQLNRSKEAEDDTVVLSLSVAQKKNLVQQAKESTKSLTLAARNEEEMSESDLDGVLQDLLALGVIDENGNVK